MQRIGHWIDNKPFSGSTERTGSVHNPATGQLTAEVAFATVDEVDLAVAAAKQAFPGWRDTSLSRRQKILFAYRELVDHHQEDLAGLLTALALILALVMPAWLAVLVVAIALLLPAGLLGLVGYDHVRQAAHVVPTEAVSGVKADFDTLAEALKNRGHGRNEPRPPQEEGREG